MSKPNKRRVRMDQFKAQLAEQVLPENRLVEVDLGNGSVVHMKLPIMLDEGDDFMERLAAAPDGEAVALVVLSGSLVPAEEQWAAWQAAGYDSTDLSEVFQAETSAARERWDAFRYKG